MNLTPHGIDGGHRKRECEIEKEKYSKVFWDLRKTLQNAQKFLSKNSKDSDADLTTSIANVLHRKKNGHVESND